MVYLPPEAKLAPKKYRESYLFQAKYLAYLPRVKTELHANHHMTTTRAHVKPASRARNAKKLIILESVGM